MSTCEDVAYVNGTLRPQLSLRQRDFSAYGSFSPKQAPLPFNYSISFPFNHSTFNHTKTIINNANTTLWAFACPFACHSPFPTTSSQLPINLSHLRHFPTVPS